MIVEKHPVLRISTHILLLLGLLLILFPIYVAFVASTHTVKELMVSPIPMTPGSHFLHNYGQALFHGGKVFGGVTVLSMLFNSFIMAFLIAIGKVGFSLLSAFAIVYFRFPFRRLSFWLIFSTLLLPVQVRIVPTFQIVAQLDLINHFGGLTLPLIASATATFLFRQFFMTLPDELCDAARVDGAGPCRFFWDVVLPLSKTNMVALFIVMFIYGWNQYLWPLVATTTQHMSTVVMGIQKLANAADQIPQWNDIMVTAILALLPPLLVMIVMQRWFVKGLVEVEK
jgi:sn-glycerol 3-phosphate transport system permease protein